MRNLTAGVITQLTASTIRPMFFFEGIFASTTIRLWSGFTDLLWDSQTWLGNGWFKGVSDIAENTSINSKGIDILLSGVPSTLISLILSEQRHTARGSVWLGCFNSSEALVADPYLLFEGGLSSPRIDDSADNSEVILTYEDDLIIMQKNKEMRYDHQAQQAQFAGDLGFEFVATIQDWKGFWGNKTKPAPTSKSKSSTSRTKDKSKRR